MQPIYKEYGLIHWLVKQGPDMLKSGWYTAYFEGVPGSGTVHACVMRRLYDISKTYRAYVERVWGHEYGHFLGHDHVADEGDIMGTTFGDNLADLGGMKDCFGVMEASAHWRESVRAK